MPKTARPLPAGVRLDDFFPQGRVMLVKMRRGTYQEFCKNFTASLVQKILYGAEARKQAAEVYFDSFANAYNHLKNQNQAGRYYCAIIFNDTFDPNQKIKIENISTFIEMPGCSSYDHEAIVDVLREKLLLIRQGCEYLLSSNIKDSTIDFLRQMQSIGAAEPIVSKLNLFKDLAWRAIGERETLCMARYLNPFTLITGPRLTFNPLVQKFYYTLSAMDDKKLKEMVSGMIEIEMAPMNTCRRS